MNITLAIIGEYLMTRKTSFWRDIRFDQKYFAWWNVQKLAIEEIMYRSSSTYLMVQSQ